MKVKSNWRKKKQKNENINLRKVKKNLPGHSAQQGKLSTTVQGNRGIDDKE